MLLITERPTTSSILWKPVFGTRSRGTVASLTSAGRISTPSGKGAAATTMVVVCTFFCPCLPRARAHLVEHNRHHQCKEETHAYYGEESAVHVVFPVSCLSVESGDLFRVGA